jgi:hypothetical protein
MGIPDPDQPKQSFNRDPGPAGLRLPLTDFRIEHPRWNSQPPSVGELHRHHFVLEVFQAAHHPDFSAEARVVAIFDLLHAGLMSSMGTLF